MTPIRREDAREAAIEKMADHLLREGMAGASLRPLAAAAGTSDRMLLYYFANKEELLTATVQRVALRLAGLLDTALPPEPRRAFPQLLAEVRAAVASPSLKPFMDLWLELAAGAARNLQPHFSIAGLIADGFVNWIAVRLEAERPDECIHLAALLLAAIEGFLLLDALGRRDLADRAVAQLMQPFKPKP
jgi:AcrR family transcriptional regulator